MLLTSEENEREEPKGWAGMAVGGGGPRKSWNIMSCRGAAAVAEGWLWWLLRGDVSMSFQSSPMVAVGLMTVVAEAAVRGGESGGGEQEEAQFRDF